MSHRRVIINTHIEKTAGTSLLQFFQDTLGKEHVAFYDPITDSLIRVSDLLVSPANSLVDKLQLKSYAFWPILKKTFFFIRTPKRTKDVVPESVVLVHGHFLANRFDKIVTKPIRTVVIREPLARMYSQYDHWKRAKGRNQWRVMIPYDDTMTFETFALLPQLQDYQTQALAGKKLSEFAIVGVTERMDLFTKSLTKLFIRHGLLEKKMKKESVQKRNPRKNNYKVSKTFSKKFEAFHKRDYLLYKQAKELAA